MDGSDAAAVSAGWSCVRRSPMRNQMTRAEEVEAVVSVAGRARGARDANPRDSLETRAVGAEHASCRRTRASSEGARANADDTKAVGRCAIADIGAVAFATLRGAREGVAGVAPGARADRTRRARYPRYAQLRSQHIIIQPAAHQRASGSTRRRHRREDDEYLSGLASVPGGHCGAREWCTMATTLTARCASLTSMASTPRRANLGARATRSVRRTGPRAMRRHPSHVTLAGSERDDSSPDDEGADAPAPERKRINITGMGSRYANVEEISDGALVVAFLLAVASTLAVGWLVATAPSKKSPQFRNTLPVDEVPLGFVDEIEDRETYGRA